MERLTYWKCSKCLGNGEVLVNGHGHGRSVVTCSACDGTGNGLVDGKARAAAREIAEVKRAQITG